MKKTPFKTVVESFKSRNGARVMQNARSANALAKVMSGNNRQLLYAVKSRAVDHLIARMDLLTDVSDLSLERGVIIGVRFSYGALHVKFTHLSLESQAIVVAKLASAVDTGKSVANSIKSDIAEAFLDSTHDLVKSKSQLQPSGVFHE
jgi:hypothetical protein